MSKIDRQKFDRAALDAWLKPQKRRKLTAKEAEDQAIAIAVAESKMTGDKANTPEKMRAILQIARDAEQASLKKRA